MLDHPAMVRELRSLEKRMKPGGRAVVNHPQAGHDDHANALALAAVMTAQRSGDCGVIIGPILERMLPADETQSDRYARALARQNEIHSAGPDEWSNPTWTNDPSGLDPIA